ncbi:esterase [Desmospora sp. 8437]|nr:esterase [Desmospora sp. 8437]
MIPLFFQKKAPLKGVRTRSIVKKPFIPIGHKSRQGAFAPGLAMQGGWGFTWSDFGSSEQRKDM